MTGVAKGDDLKKALEEVQSDNEAGAVVRLLHEQVQAAKTLKRSLASITQVVSPEAASRAQVTENAWREMDQEFRLLTAAEVAELVGSTSKNRKSYAADARRDGRILGVKRMNQFVYPAFQFEDGNPRPMIRQLWTVAQGWDISAESVLLWLTAPTIWWGAETRPVDRLSEPEEVVEAFESHFGTEW